jgi:hypothetical protein
VRLTARVFKAPRQLHLDAARIDKVNFFSSQRNLHKQHTGKRQKRKASGDVSMELFLSIASVCLVYELLKRIFLLKCLQLSA